MRYTCNLVSEYIEKDEEVGSLMDEQFKQKKKKGKLQFWVMQKANVGRA